MDLRALEVFLDVAETLNFSRSAERLHLSVSAVSRTIQRLESDVGQPLLVRDRRTVQLTGAGGAFREYARAAVADWRQLRRRLRSDRELVGELSLYGSVTASYRVLTPILERFRTLHPAVDLMLQTGDQAEGIDRVLAGENDMSVSSRPEQLSDRLQFLPLLESPLRICVPAVDCAVRRQVLDLRPADSAAWSSIPFIFPERGVTRDILSAWLLERELRPRVYAQVAGHEAIVAMVALGLGVGIAPELVVDASGMRDRVDYLPLDTPLSMLSVGLCCLRSRLEDSVLTAFWDSARQAYSAGV